MPQLCVLESLPLVTCLACQLAVPHGEGCGCDDGEDCGCGRDEGCGFGRGEGCGCDAEIESASVIQNGCENVSGCSDSVGHDHVRLGSGSETNGMIDDGCGGRRRQGSWPCPASEPPHRRRPSARNRTTLARTLAVLRILRSGFAVTLP